MKNLVLLANAGWCRSLSRTMLTDDQVKKFQLLYKKQFGVEIGEAEAREKGQRMVRLIELILRPQGSEKRDDIQAKIQNDHEAQI